MIRPLLTQLPTTVVDITYLCNATCSYCQWGSSETQGRMHRNLEELMIPRETLAALRTQRIVLSGGEPRLHPEIRKLLAYYRNLVKDVVIMTNGYGLTVAEVKNLLHSGATGITLSLDSIDAGESMMTRCTPPALHASILDALMEISKLDQDFELGINSVVSHVTANWRTVSGLLSFANELDTDFVKFQPIFDDGYVSKRSSHLLLTNADVEQLLEIASNIDSIRHPFTNPAEFWKDIATVASGESLPSHLCGLGSSNSIAIRGKLSICFWVGSSQYGQTQISHGIGNIRRVQSNFEEAKRRCNVEYHCFCNQSIDHKWSA